MVESPLEIRLLGQFLVLRGSEEIPASAFGGRKVRALVRVLATRRETLVSHDVLTEALWPDRPPADPPANLGVLVNRARRALGDAVLIRTGQGGYALAGGQACTVDAEEFLVLVRAGQEAAAGGDPRRALSSLREALQLWAGEPLPEDAYAGWAAEFRDRLRRAHQDALEAAAVAALAVGEAAVAVEMAAAAAAEEPLREVAALTLVRALAAAGDHAAALTHFAEFRRALAIELGVDPTPAAQLLYDQLVRGAPVGRADARGRPVAASLSTHDFTELSFVGRDTELKTVVAAVAAGAPRTVIAVLGGAGAGKSRLLAEVADRVDVPVLAARAFLPERAEPWGLARALLGEALATDVVAASQLRGRTRDALGELLPELTNLDTGVAAGVLDPESRRALVLEGALQILGSVAVEGALLLLDDLQWADPSSLVLLGSALARLPMIRCVLAARPDELTPGSAPAIFLAETRAGHRVVDVHLVPLAAAAIDELFADPELARAVTAGTERTPFAVTELLRALAEQGAIARDVRGRWRSRSANAVRMAAGLAAAGQRRAVRARAARFVGLSGEVLALVALLSRETPARVLAAAAGVAQPEVLAALVELAGGGLLRLGDQGWATAHDLVGETVTAGLGSAERGRLHALLAKALEADAADPSEVARHHAAGGDGDAAARAFLQAAQRALDDSATSEAAGLADAGLALQPKPACRAELLEVRAEARAHQGDLVAARADLRAALGLQPHGPARSRLLARLAMQSSGSDDLVRAAELAELALVEAGTDELARARALEVGSILDMNLDQPERANGRADTALTLYRRHGDAPGVARILDGRAMATFLGGRIGEAEELFDRVAGLFADSGDLLRVVTPRSTRGHAMVFLARPDDGLIDADAALELASSLGDPEGQSYALWHRSEALSAIGRLDEAEQAARDALDIASRLRHRGWTATALRALGIALTCRGDLSGAQEAFSESLTTAEHMPLFASWAAARLALVLVASGRLAEAAPLVDRATVEGPPLGHYEARLARVELAAARHEEKAASLAAEALSAAEAGGHLASVPRLVELASP